MYEINQRVTFSLLGNANYEKVKTGQISNKISETLFNNIINHYNVKKDNCHSLDIKINEIEEPVYNEKENCDERFFELLIKLLFIKEEVDKNVS